MRSLRGFRLFIVLLLGTSIFVSIADLTTVPNVQAAPSLTVTPSQAPPGFGTLGSRITIQGSGWTPTKPCQITSPGGVVNNTYVCNTDVNGILSGSFGVNKTAFVGSYTLNVSIGLTQFQTAPFTVTSPPAVQLTPASGSNNTAVTITSTTAFANTGISPNLDQGLCFLSSIPPGLFASGYSCFIDSAGNLYSTQFIVAPTATAGGYAITVTGSHGDWATIGFTVVTTSFSVTLNPIRGQPGQVILVNANGAPINTACTLSSTNPNLIGTTSGLAASNLGTVTGTFTVASNAAGRAGGVPDNVTLICGTGGSISAAKTRFTVIPQITLSPTVGAGNQAVVVNGVGFRADVTGCQITTTPTGINFTTLASCTVTGTGAVSGSFTANSANANGVYNITVRGFVSGINITQAFAFYQKVSAPTISVSPTATSPGYGTLDGTPITVSGGGFPTGTSRSCTLSSSGGPAFLATSPAVSCAIDVSGTVTGVFAVATGASPGNYTLTVTDTTSQPFPPTFPSASTPFRVNGLVNITLTPSTGPTGTTVTILTSKGALRYAFPLFQPTFDAGTCTISSTPSNIISSPVCFIITQGNLSLSTQFVVANVGAGGYTVKVTGLHGDFGVAIFTVTTTIPVSINPSTGSPPLGSLPGTTVTITGNGFSLSDTSCIITQIPNDTNHPYFVSGLSCSISGGSLSATFVVAAGATNDTYKFRVKGTPAFDLSSLANFTVVPRIALSPNSGPGGTLVSVSGSGFKGGSGFAPCVKFSFVPFALNGSLHQCNRFNDGTVTGSFNVSLTAPQGAYLVAVTATGSDIGSAPFVVGARLLTVTPSTGVGLMLVSVNGTGFSLSDTSCTLTTTSATIYVSSTNLCSITNGVVLASFQVDPMAKPGIYNVKVNGSIANDVGFGVFSVAVATTTTVTLTSITSTSLTSTTTTTVTTTTQFSTSLSTTTFSKAGVSTSTFNTLTTTTVSGITTLGTATSTTFTSSTTSSLSSTSTTITTLTTTLTSTLGLIIRSVEQEPSFDGFGLLAILVLLGPWALRRFLD